MRIPIGLVLIIAVLEGIFFFKLSPKTQKPDDKKVTKTENSNDNANTEVQNSDNNPEKKFQSAMKKGEDALREGNYQVAIDAFTKALLYKKDDTTAKAKLKVAQDKLKEDSENQAMFESAMKKGEEALSSKKYIEAIDAFTKALSYKKDDNTAKAKLKEAQDKLNKDS
jgi:tetratricopeptide (TPR) repeat protein